MLLRNTYRLKLLGIAVQLSELAMEGPRKVRDREQRFGGRGFVRYGHDQGGDDDEDEDEIDSVKGERR